MGINLPEPLFSEEIPRRLSGEQPEVTDKMGLIEISCFIGCFRQGGIRSMFADEVSQTDDGGVLLGRGAYTRPEAFFKSVLADIQGSAEVPDPQEAAVLADALNGGVDQQIFPAGDAFFKQERFDDPDPLRMAWGFRQALQDFSYVGCREQVFGSDALFE